MYRVVDLFNRYAEVLSLRLFAGEKGLNTPIKVPEVHRPGLSLAGFLKGHAHNRILIFGRMEIEYLRDLAPRTRMKRLKPILSDQTPCVLVSRRYRPPPELKKLCEELNIPLFRSNHATMALMTRMTVALNEEFSESVTTHGTLVEVFGVGVLIQGDSSVGKSEAALGLIEREHRLITDDVVRIQKREDCYLEGRGPEITRHHMEIRGIGIINVAHLYGAVCVRESKSIDLVVELQDWDENRFYDRVGMEEQTRQILGIDLPYHLLPVKPGRDVVLLLETIALNHRLKAMGYHSAQEFRHRLTERMDRHREWAG